MRVIPPIAIKDAILTSSTCAEPSATESAYNAATPYILGAVVVVAADHRTYQSLQAGNVGHTPISSPTWWIDIGATNRWKMFDLLRNTQTDQASPLTVVISPGARINSLALLGLVADSVTISATSGGVSVYTKTQSLINREVLNWYDYFFSPFSTIPSMIVFDLPPIINAIFTIAITRASGNVKCGSLAAGTFVYIGDTQYNAESDALNFSTVSRDAVGNSILIQSRTVPKTNQTISCNKQRVNQVRALRDLLNAAPAVWSGLDDYTDDYFESLLILGYYRQFTINLEHPNDALITLALEEI
jgi:hypothetical protein